MRDLKLTAIRGNISEIKTLALGSGTTKGVDADMADAVTEETLDDAVSFVKGFAESAGCIIEMCIRDRFTTYWALVVEVQ